MTIIPSINCQDFECVCAKFDKAKGFLHPQTDWVHIDVADAAFTYGRSWNNPSELKKLQVVEGRYPFNIEVHLMVENLEKVFEDWLKVGVRRIVFHFESLKDEERVAKLILETCKNYGAEAMIAINPVTPVEKLVPFLDYFNEFQILAVVPGPAGQPMLTINLEKVKFLRQRMPSAIIEVDGGINLATARLAKEAGANILIAGSYTFGSDNPKRSFDELASV
ncbi:MAG: hypothetical protein WCX12_01830 [Candidatus Paceibacterota bacterium]|jgi:ribulose-phosphate 3-epimerase